MYLNYWDDFLIKITDNNIQTLIDLDKWHKLIAHSGPLAPTPGKHELTLLDVVKWPGLKWEEQCYSFMYNVHHISEIILGRGGGGYKHYDIRVRLTSG